MHTHTIRMHVPYMFLSFSLLTHSFSLVLFISTFFRSKRGLKVQGKPSFSHMITQSLSSSFELWYPISWNVAGPFPGGGRATTGGSANGEGVRTGTGAC